MKKIRLNVKTKSKIYPIIIGKNIITQIPNILKSNNINFEKCLIVVDSKIPKKKLNILKKKIVSKKTIILFLNASEKNKNLKSVNLILNKLFKFNFNRNDCIISLGGGAFLNKNIRKEILKNHISFWLSWKNSTIIKRILKSKKRPIAFNSTESDLKKLITERSDIYSKANFKINCETFTKNMIVKQIVDLYEKN